MSYQRPTQFRLIEETAELLLEEYQKSYGRIISPPIPVEMIAEQILGLRCEIVGLKKFGKNVVGVLLSKERRILISESGSDTHYNFTIAHEIGHWVLHVPTQRSLDYIDDTQTVNPMRSLMVSSRRQSKKEAVQEGEANKFAAALLIPRSRLINVTKEISRILAGDVYKLASVFETSPKTMYYRLKYLVKNSEDLGTELDWNTLQELED